MVQLVQGVQSRAKDLVIKFGVIAVPGQKPLDRSLDPARHCAARTKLSPLFQGTCDRHHVLAEEGICCQRVRGRRRWCAEFFDHRLREIDA